MAPNSERVPGVGYWLEPRSLPLAVLTRRRNVWLIYQCRVQ